MSATVTFAIGGWGALTLGALTITGEWWLWPLLSLPALSGTLPLFFHDDLTTQEVTDV